MRFLGYTIERTANRTPHRGWDYGSYDDIFDPPEYAHLGASPDEVKQKIIDEFWGWFLGYDS